MDTLRYTDKLIPCVDTLFYCIDTLSGLLTLVIFKRDVNRYFAEFDS